MTLTETIIDLLKDGFIISFDYLRRVKAVEIRTTKLNGEKTYCRVSCITLMEAEHYISGPEELIASTLKRNADYIDQIIAASHSQLPKTPQADG